MKKLKFVLSFMVVFGLIFVIAGCTEQVYAVSADDTYVTLDINPSVELIVTPKEKVIYANPLNEDGELLLANLDLIGLDLEEAIDLIIEEAINLGFIDTEAEETLVSVSAISQNSEYGELIRNKVKANIDNAFMNRAMMGRAEDKGFTPEFITEAEGYGVTPGFLFLAYKAVEVNDELLLADALLLTQEELMEIVHEARLAKKEVAQALKAEFFTARQLILDEYLPQIQALEAEIALGEGDIAALEAELEALKTELHDAVTTLRDDFHAQTAALREGLMEQRQVRIQEHRAEVEAFMNQLQERKNDMQDAIENWQNNRP